ncbi:hypothetical protein [Massilia suwonensis]|uniref:Energy transducer TonB n=1 Tax=Massilia suwonensis TaxID=648895 RepID=A0ABW0MKB3_9BURK
MKLAATGGLVFEDDAGRAQRRIAAGIAVSLALHALVLNLQRDGWRREAQEPPRPIAVRLQPPPPAPPAPEAAPTPPSQPAPRPTPRARTERPKPVIAVDSAPAQPEPFTVQQAPQPEPEAPHFDREAARQMARSLANMRDPAKEGTAVGQFPDKPLETETRAARAIGAAKRRDCKDGLPGGLLGPLLILADKKDSGCKW